MGEKLKESETQTLVALQMEYEAIRSEIILLMNEQNTHIASLFVMGITILGLGYTLEEPNWLSCMHVISPFTNSC